MYTQNIRAVFVASWLGILLAFPQDLLHAQTSRYVNEMPKWRRYAISLRHGDIAAADKAIQELNASFKSEQLRAEFWDSVLPAVRRSTIRFYRVCNSCTAGQCGLCGGSGSCASCRGTGNCGLCGGLGVLRKPCESCVCQQCRGAGVCQQCQGKRGFTCPKCNGRGSFSEKTGSPCKKCNGIGKLKNEAGRLKGGGGTVKPIGGQADDGLQQCTACRGKGQIEGTTQKDCEDCSGSGKTPCPSCQGSGSCSACKGLRRIAKCPNCGGMGTIARDCPRCLKSGKCTLCLGEKKCQKCGGDGFCTVCAGKAILYVKSLTADTMWLNSPGSCVVETAANYHVDGQPVATVRPDVSFGVVEAGQIGRLTRQQAGPGLSSKAGETICISDSDDFGWVSEVLLKQVSY